MPSLTTTTNEATPSHLSCVGRGLVPNTNYSNILHLSPRIYCYKYLNRLCRCRVCPNGASGSTFFVVLGQAPIFCRLIYNHTHKTRFKLELDSIFFSSEQCARALCADYFLWDSAFWHHHAKTRDFSGTNWPSFWSRLLKGVVCVCTTRQKGRKKDTTFSSHFQHHFTVFLFQAAAHSLYTLTPFF